MKIFFKISKINKEKIENIRFKNEGKTPGKIELKFDKLNDIKIDPVFFTIPPGKETSVKVIYKYP
jgi:hypothetical protein